MTEEQIKLLKEYNININNICENMNDIYKYNYIDMGGLLIVDLFDISREYFEMFEITNIIKVRKEYILKALENREFGKILFLMDKPYRLEVFKTIFEIIPDEDKYNLFIELYITSEYGFNSISKSFWEKVLRYKPNKSFDLPREITIYRGEGKLSTPKEMAYSWSLDKKVGEFFQNRFVLDGEPKGKLYKAKVKTCDIIDYLTDREESEILVEYRYLYNVEEVE